MWILHSWLVVLGVLVDSGSFITQVYLAGVQVTFCILDKEPRILHSCLLQLPSDELKGSPVACSGSLGNGRAL